MAYCRFGGSAGSGEFGRTDWFGEDLVSLAPEPAGPFRALTSAVHAAFPVYPRFGGVYADVVPYLTMGDRPAGGAGSIRARVPSSS